MDKIINCWNYPRCKIHVSLASNSSPNEIHGRTDTMHYAEFEYTMSLYHYAYKFDHRNIVRPIFLLHIKRYKEGKNTYTHIYMRMNVQFWFGYNINVEYKFRMYLENIMEMYK